jgi:type IV secretion system protein VirB2
MNVSINAEKLKSIAWCMLLAYAMFLVPQEALAQFSDGGDTIGSLLCNVAGWFTGPVGQGIATLAIIVIGIGALMGKVSWGMAIIVGIGVAVIFGAPAIVSELGAGGDGCAY